RSSRSASGSCTCTDRTRREYRRRARFGGGGVNVEFAYAAGWRVVRALPEPVARGLFRVGADIAYRRNGRGVRQLRENLRRVVGDEELEPLVHKGMRSYLRYYLEAFRLPSMSTDRILRSFRLGGNEMLGQNVAVGRGSIVTLPHGGN